MNRLNFGVQRVRALVRRSARFALLSFLCIASLLNQAHAQSAARLQPLLNDTVSQFKLVYRHDVNELHRRYEEVSKIVAEWRKADRTEENNRRLEAWLRAAIRSSMPGSREGLPPLPTFVNLPAPVPPTTRAPEHSLIPVVPAGELPTPPTFTAPTNDPRISRPQAEAKAPPSNVEVNKPTAGEAKTGMEAASDTSTVAPVIEAPANDELPPTDDLPEIDEASDTDELPEVDELPEIEEDPALIEALGDPFADDPESTD